MGRRITRKDFCGGAAGAVLTQMLLGEEAVAATQPSVEISANAQCLVENSNYLTTQILTYLGNKRTLLKFIGAGVESVKEMNRAA